MTPNLRKTCRATGVIALTMLAAATLQAAPPVAPAWRAFLDSPPGQAPFIDFSWAGANYGERPIAPSVKTEFRVADHGAIPNDAVDDTDAIQRTIDAAAAGGGGIVQFSPGTYVLNSGATPRRLSVSASYIVLRGATRGRTRLRMINNLAPANPAQIWASPALVTFRPAIIAPSEPRSLAAAAKLGDKVIVLSSPAKYQPGDFVRIAMTSPAANAFFLEGKATRQIWSKINGEGVTVQEMHEVDRVDGATLHLKTPLTTPVSLDYPWTAVKVPVLRNVGFEGIALEGNFTAPFEHHKDAYHDSGFRGVILNQTVHSWIRRSDFTNVSQPAMITGGAANSILLNTISGNGGHFSFSAEFSTNSLIGLNIDRTNNGQFHGPGASHRSTASVIWRTVGPTSAGIDSHANFTRNTLFDAVESRGFGRWGGSFVDLPNHLGGLVLWNFHQTGADVGEHFDGVLDFWKLPTSDAQPYGFYTAVNPIIVGYVGPIRDVNRANVRLVESLGRHVTPESLYEAMLVQRRGTLPPWVTAAKKEWAAQLKSQLRRNNPALGGR